MSLQVSPRSTPAQAPGQAPASWWPKMIAGVVGTSVMLAVLVIAFALPAAHSAPHDVPIGIVGTPAQVQGFSSKATGFRVRSYSSEQEARQAILTRDVYGALVLDSPTQVGVLVATAASPTAAALVQAVGQQMSAVTHRPVHVDDVRAFPSRDPKGTGLAAGALPLALGGWIGAMVIMLLVPSSGGRVAGAVAFAIVGGLTVVATLQYVIGTFDGNFWLTSLAGMFGIAATCFTVLGLRELLGGAGLGVAAVLLVLLGNPLSGLASGPEFLPQPWGAIGQFLPPGATGTLMRDVTFFDGHGATRSLVTLSCYLIIGATLYAIAVRRARRNGTVDVDRIEFDHQPRSNPNPPNQIQDPIDHHPRSNPNPPNQIQDPGNLVTQPLGRPDRQEPNNPPFLRSRTQPTPGHQSFTADPGPERQADPPPRPPR